jgi:hypothetical protein
MPGGVFGRWIGRGAGSPSAAVELCVVWEDRMKRITLVPITVLLAGAASTCPGMWASIGLPSLVHSHSQLIVSGKIVEIRQDTTNRFPVVGVIQVESMLYGPPDTKQVLLSVQSRINGNSYRVGDSGVWFLTQQSSDPGPETLEREMPAPPLCGCHVSDIVFEAEAPSTFWPNDPEEFGKRAGILYERMTPEQKAERMRQLLDLVKRRLELDLQYLERKRTETDENVKLINGMRVKSGSDR